MTPYDAVMAFLVIAGFIQGAWRGMAWQLAPIASLILGYLVAYPMSVKFAPWFGNQAPMNHLLAFLVIYLVVSLCVYLVAYSVKKYIIRLKLQEFDRHLGAILGGIKGLLLYLVVTFFLVAMSPRACEYICGTYSGYAAAIVMDHLHPIMPPEIHDALEPYIHRLETPDMDLRHNHGTSNHDQTNQHGPAPLGDIIQLPKQVDNISKF